MSLSDSYQTYVNNIAFSQYRPCTTTSGALHTHTHTHTNCRYVNWQKPFSKVLPIMQNKLTVNCKQQLVSCACVRKTQFFFAQTFVHTQKRSALNCRLRQCFSSRAAACTQCTFRCALRRNALPPSSWRALQIINCKKRG